MATGKAAKAPPRRRRPNEPTDRYWELVRAHPLRPIRSEAELDRAIAVIDGLVDRGLENLSRDEDDYLDVLSTLVHDYEQTQRDDVRVTAEEMLRDLIETRGLTQAAVAAGSDIHETTLSNVLAGRRKLTREHIEALARFFRVDPGLFLG